MSGEARKIGRETRHREPRSAPPATRRSWRYVAALAFGLAITQRAQPAEACGGAFFSSRSETVAVKGHQMAISIARDQTIVWDRIEVTGNPSEVAWVIPIREGTRLELASEGFFTLLSKVTAPKVTEARKSSGGGGGGCMGSAEGASLGSGNQDKGVEVLARENVGPYETARLRASTPGAIRSWLDENGFAIPTDVNPILDAYTREGFDFLALKVRPSAQVGLQPLRLVVPGMDPTLPLRMSRAGVGSHADLTFYVLGEGRYKARGFEEAEVAENRLAFVDGASNYERIVTEQITEGPAPRFIVEYAGTDAKTLDLETTNLDRGCVSSGSRRLDGSGATTPAIVCVKDDVDAARSHLGAPMWITRLRTSFPASAFASDLTFDANAEQVPVSSQHEITAAPAATIAPVRSSAPGTAVILAATLVGLVVITRRRSPRV